MRILRHYEEIPPALRGAVVAVGNFDGVHLGHRALIGEAARLARERGSPLGVLAFEPHPQEFFRPSPESFRLTPFRAKARLIAGLGVDAMFALPFDSAMARLSAPDFVLKVLVQGLGAAAVVVGGDFRFGRHRAGDATALAYMGAMEGFGVTLFDTVAEPGLGKISSTHIREALKAGKTEAAAALLGHFWAVEARVEHGDARGRTIGYPTANLHPDCLIPQFGVYAVRVSVLENDHPSDFTRVALRRDGVANFGIRPMYRTPHPLLESFLFDFDGDLYGKYLSVELVSYIRPEQKFSGLEALKDQIGRDVVTARAALARLPAPPVLDA